MTLTSISTVLPHSSMCKLLDIPYGMYVLPSDVFNVVDDCDKGGEPKFFEQLIDIIQVDAPSSMIVR